MNRLTETQANEIYRRALIGRAALKKARAMSLTVLGEKMGLCKNTVYKISNQLQGMKRDGYNRNADDTRVILELAKERNEHLSLAALHTSSVIAADFGCHKRTVDAIFIGESWPFIRRSVTA
jgi:hypothetical protein